MDLIEPLLCDYAASKPDSRLGFGQIDLQPQTQQRLGQQKSGTDATRIRFVKPRFEAY